MRARGLHPGPRRPQPARPRRPGDARGSGDGRLTGTVQAGPRYSLADGETAARAYVRWAVREAAPLADLDPDTGRATYLDAGIMNYVYRVETNSRVFYLKQALPRVKQHDRLGPDLAGVSPARIQAEARALGLLQRSLPARWRGSVPRAAWYDDANNVLWTAEIAPGATALQERLAAGVFDARAAERIGRLLAAVHSLPGGTAGPVWPTEAEDRENWERFLRMRTTGFLARAELPLAAERAADELHEQARRHERTGMLSHLDAAPKNVLVGPGDGVVLLDFELGAARSDPAYDPGFLAGHYLLMGENRSGGREPAWTAARALIRGYVEEAGGVDAGWRERLARYAGLVLLYRLHGSSPAPYLAPERFGTIREAGIRLLVEGRL